MVNKALINIDYTFDFAAVDGRLSCGEKGQLIEREVSAITERFIQNGDFTVFAIDVHELNDHYHPERALFPPHNIRNSAGRNLFGSLREVYERNKQSPHIYYLDKTRYSAFAGTDLELKLRERGITELHLVGLCTDICVLHTAVDAYNKGFSIAVYKDAVASFSQQGHDWAMEHFKAALGATIIKGKGVC